MYMCRHPCMLSCDYEIHYIAIIITNIHNPRGNEWDRLKYCVLQKAHYNVIKTVWSQQYIVVTSYMVTSRSAQSSSLPF